MRVLSWNLLRHRGAGVQDIARLAAAHRPDLVLMQEATAAIDALPALLGGCYARAPMERRSHGPAAWSPHPFGWDTVALPMAPRLDLPVAVLRLLARRLALVVRLRGVRIAAVHLDHGQRANRQQVRHLLRACPDLNAVVGDFNAVGPVSLPGFADVGPRCATFRVKGVLPLRLDRCLLRGATCRQAAALPRGPSDHRPILLDLDG
jgi:endonuclease/exonuclease/phosphatase family metal-dependent hydrolase